MLRIENLTKYYGDIRGVENLSLELKDGEIFGFIGPNGAGKSTTIKCIMNFINKTSGNIYINDVLVEDKNFEYKNLIGYLPSEIHLYDDYTVLEMFKYSSLFYSNKTLERALEISKRLELETNKKIEDLSLGNLKKVGIVLAFMHEPKLLILDEPTSGLDPIIQEEFFNILKEEKKKGTTIFFSSHVLSEIKKVCDRVGIIKEGHLIKVDTIFNFNKNNYLNIHIESKNIEKISKELNIDIINNNFIYKGDINILINKLSKYKIAKLLINEPEIEELFIDYYKEEVC